MKKRLMIYERYNTNVSKEMSCKVEGPLGLFVCFFINNAAHSDIIYRGLLERVRMKELQKVEMRCEV